MIKEHIPAGLRWVYERVSLEAACIADQAFYSAELITEDDQVVAPLTDAAVETVGDALYQGVTTAFERVTMPLADAPLPEQIETSLADLLIADLGEADAEFSGDSRFLTVRFTGRNPIVRAVDIAMTNPPEIVVIKISKPRTFFGPEHALQDLDGISLRLKNLQTPPLP